MRGKLKHLGPEERAALEAMVDAALNKMLHAPTKKLREVATGREYEGFRAEQLVATLIELFDLDSAEVDAPHSLRAVSAEDGEDKDPEISEPEQHALGTVAR